MPLVRLDQLQQFAAVNLRLDPGAIGGKIVIPNCVQIGFIWSMESGRSGHCLTYGRAPGVPAPTIAQANSIMSALQAAAQFNPVLGFLHPSTQFNNVTLRSVHSEDQPIFTSTVGGSVGTGTGSALPSEVAAVLTKRTNFTGPGNRGRFYIPGFATNALGAGNVIAAACVTALNNWGAIFNSSISAGGYTHVIGQQARAAYDGSSGTHHNARPAGSVDVISVTCRDNHWDSQRRRGLK